jgi:hypothetical protein
VALKLEDALNAYGFVGQIANAIPELKTILEQAIKGEWVPEQFTREVMDSNWWKQNSDSARRLAILQKTDPTTYWQNLKNATDKIVLMGQQMGRTQTRAQSGYVALQALLQGWDDEQIRRFLSNAQLGNNEGAYRGDAAQLDSHMREVAQNYGVAYTKTGLETWINSIQSGANTLDGWEALMKSRAKAQYAHLADQIDAGMTVRDIADPYIASYAQTLEVAETTIDWQNDVNLKRALQMHDGKGGLTTKPMHQFVRELKNDPRWDNTQNAEQEAYRMVSKLGKDMGFLA